MNKLNAVEQRLKKKRKNAMKRRKDETKRGGREEGEGCTFKSRFFSRPVIKKKRDKKDSRKSALRSAVAVTEIAMIEQSYPIILALALLSNSTAAIQAPVMWKMVI